MNSYIWQNLQRSVNDPTTIDEAISEAVAAHNDDAIAHMNPDAAIENHRESEVIDHPAESVVNDKIANHARRWVAIVDPNNENDFDTLDGAIEHARQMGGGDIFVTRGTHYLGADVALIPTISLYGAGINETIISSNSSTARTLTWRTALPLEGSYFYPANATPPRNYLDYNDGDLFGDMPAIGSAIRIHESQDASFIITSIDEANKRMYVTGTIAPLDAEEEIEILPTFTLMNGSSEATYNWSNLTMFNYYYTGLSIYRQAEGIDLVTTEYLGDGKLKLASAYTGTNKTVFATVEYSKPASINIEGISLTRTANPVRIATLLIDAYVTITDCANVRVSGGQLGKLNAVYTNCYFDAWATATNQADYDLFFRSTLTRCRFSARRNNVVAIGLGDNSALINCSMLSGGYSGLNWLRLNRASWQVIGCDIQGQAADTIVASSITGPQGSRTFTGNNIMMNNNASITIQGNNVYMAGNRILTSGTGRLVFGASSTNNFCRGNLVSFAPTNSGTGNSIGDNLTIV